MRRLLLALLLLCLSSAPAPANQRVRLRLDAGTDTTQTLDIPGVGSAQPADNQLRELQVDVTGTTSVTYSLTRRLCGADSAGTFTCGAWDATPLASGTITGGSPTPGTLVLELDRYRDEYRLVLTVSSGTPTAIRVFGLYW